ncbi:MAG: AAC(3) family N-acetyltransferase [Armatimonadota bacterium]
MLSKTDITAGLIQLGLVRGDRVLVHSSLISLGRVDGSADTVIDALLETVGPEGLVAVPTFACEPPFDAKTSTTPLGAIADTFWRRPNAFRSKHPTHSVAAIGKGAQELVRDHEKASTAYGEDTPYLKLARNGGKILLLGVDQDRNTTLHASEAITGAVYLDTIKESYIDVDGSEKTLTIPLMAGPHRDFIWLDKLFRETGVMKVGKIGNAVCRLLEAGPMLDLAIDALRKDPAAVLCDNPACEDCVTQRGAIKADRLAGESFTLAAVAGDISDDPKEIILALRGECISCLEMTPEDFRAFGRELMDARIRVVAIRASADDEKAAKLATELGLPVVAPVATDSDLQAALKLETKCGVKVLMATSGAQSSFYQQIYTETPNAPRLAFSPAGFVSAGEKPFLEVFYKGLIRKMSEHYYIDDALKSGEQTLPGRGNGEVKEIISMLRCRSYDGLLTLRSPVPGIDGFRESAAAFWKLLDNM